MINKDLLTKLSSNKVEIIGNVVVSDSAKISSSVVLNAGETGRIIIGDRVNIKRGTIINSYSGDVEINNRVTIGEYCVFYAHGSVLIKELTIIAPHVVIAAQNHIQGAKVPIRFSGETAYGVVINSNCLISANVSILDGVNKEVTV